MRYSIVAPALLAGTAYAWLPQERDLAAFNQTARFEKLGKRFEPSLASGITKIRGVNFGGSSKSEFDCMLDHYKGSNRAAGNQKFQNHWRDWINPATVQSVHDVGLNTIRIPIGYWSYTAIVDTASEPFADGNLMLPYLDAVVQKAADLGIYVIIDLHGAPGGQQQDAFTGQNPNPAGFYNSYDYGRAEKWLAWMTNRIHTNPAYSTVGMIEVLNEPVSRHDGGGRYPAPGQDPSLVQTYYPGALKAVRDAEAALNVPSNKKLHVQFMSSKWDSGDARTNAAVANDPMTGFDDHNYIGFALGGNNGDQYSLMHSACTDSRVVNGQNFAITGEWSMTSGVDWHDGAFFKKFFTAQQQLYESPGMDGWIYWTWKTELNDPRWTYSYATFLNYIPTNAAALQQNVFQDVCSGFR
ncbi:spr1-exo-1,3-beta-glucanase precursor [Trichoderma arundinaceum]|uniref:glucan endo-1,6-beta-glucosidase n=1 Tax=Trichoderma arundinaceum TaxID=490622 RepID=A0A395P0E9_TRIAR|nr:spr1-exo-1,3-beta-glucanase precursor [Trichoderma arundinaceum]